MSSASTFSTSRYINDLDRLRSVISPSTICERLGIPITGGKILCPAHDDHRPSMQVYSDHFYCFVCHARVDNLGFVGLHLVNEQFPRGDGFWRVLDWIADAGGLPRPTRDPQIEARHAAIQTVSQTYEALFQRALEGTDEAVRYMEGRGFTEKDVRDKVGYLPAESAPLDKKAAKAAGLYSQKGNYLWRDRIVFPIRRYGQIVSLCGRARDPETIPRYVYPATTDPPMPPAIWGLDEAPQQSTLYLAEGILDAWTLKLHGYHGIAAGGTQRLTHERVELIKARKPKTVIVVGDAEISGEGGKAAVRVGARLFRAGIDGGLLELPLPPGQEKEDPNSFFLHHDREEFEALPRVDFLDAQLDAIPQGISIRATHFAIQVILRDISAQPETTWRAYTEQISRRFKQFERRQLEKQVRQIHSGGAEDLRPERFVPLPYVEKIRGQTPTIACDGRIFQYHEGVYRSIYLEEIDQISMQLIGGLARGHEIDEIRKCLYVRSFVRPDSVNLKGKLNLKNGILNLETLKLEPHSSDFLSTVQTETAYDPAAAAIIWHESLDEILPDPDLQALLAEIFGYCLTPDNSLQVGFIFHGEGANGKSVITDVLEALVGKENCSALHLKDFKEKFRVAELQGRLINFATEVEAKKFVNDAIVKAVITGDPITAERKNFPPFSFRPCCKLIISCNQLPMSHDKTYGYFRRWLILPFTQTFEPDKADRQRSARIIKQELPGVLNWALKGLLRLRDQGIFTEVEASKRAMAEYQREQDHLIDFLSEQLSRHPGSDGGTLIQDMRPVYLQWCKANGYEAMGSIKLTQALERHTKTGKKMRGKNQSVYIPGLYLKPKDEIAKQISMSEL